jgi:hypothetical protein
MSKHKPNPARTLIQSLGGPAKVAEMLGYDKSKGGVQRVANWQTRGIPAEVRLEHPHIFAAIPFTASPSAAQPTEGAGHA